MSETNVGFMEKVSKFTSNMNETNVGFMGKASRLNLGHQIEVHVMVILRRRSKDVAECTAC